MGGGRPGPLPICERCQHFVVRDKGLSVCAPCRKSYQLQVSVKGVVSSEKDESAVVFYQGCFALLEDWLRTIKDLETKDTPTGSGSSASRHRSPSRGGDSHKPQPRDIKEDTAEEMRSDRKAVSAPAKAPPVQPSSHSRPALPVEGRSAQRATSQTRTVPRPSQPPREALRDRSPDLRLFAKKKAEPKKAPEAPFEEVEEEEKSPRGELQRTPKCKEEREEEEKSPRGELKRTPKAAEKKKKERSRSSTSSSSRRRRKREKRKREKEKKDKKKRKRSTSPGSSVSGSRVRAAKKKELKRLPTPPRPKSPHTPPGPPPDPPPAPDRREPARREPARRDNRPPLARGRGRGWIGPVPWSLHPRWYTGKNKGITRRAKQEKFNNRWW